MKLTVAAISPKVVNLTWMCCTVGWEPTEALWVKLSGFSGCFNKTKTHRKPFVNFTQEFW